MQSVQKDSAAGLKWGADAHEVSLSSFFKSNRVSSPFYELSITSYGQFSKQTHFLIPLLLKLVC